MPIVFAVPVVAQLAAVVGELLQGLFCGRAIRSIAALAVIHPPTIHDDPAQPGAERLGPATVAELRQFPQHDDQEFLDEVVAVVGGHAVSVQPVPQPGLIDGQQPLPGRGVVRPAKPLQQTDGRDAHPTEYYRLLGGSTP